jgi:hypothetical protein
MWLAKMLQEGAARHLKLHLSLLEDHSPEDVRLGLWLAPVVVDDLLEADLFQLGNLADAVDSWQQHLVQVTVVQQGGLLEKNVLHQVIHLHTSNCKSEHIDTKHRTGPNERHACWCTPLCFAAAVLHVQQQMHSRHFYANCVGDVASMSLKAGALTLDKDAQILNCKIALQAAAADSVHEAAPESQCLPC